MILSSGLADISRATDGQVGLGSPASWTTLEQVPMVQESIKHGAHRSSISQQLAPVLHWSIRGHDRTGPFIAAHNDLQKILSSGQRQLAHAEIIDDEQGQ